MRMYTFCYEYFHSWLSIHYYKVGKRNHFTVSCHYTHLILPVTVSFFGTFRFILTCTFLARFGSKPVYALWLRANHSGCKSLHISYGLFLLIFQHCTVFCLVTNRKQRLPTTDFGKVSASYLRSGTAVSSVLILNCIFV
jgi:hypothetical protein